MPVINSVSGKKAIFVREKEGQGMERTFSCILRKRKRRKWKSVVRGVKLEGMVRVGRP
tara:strand:+ start:434 stop:607 length:174 start_codon:yes stop_codon:yes gene_type:complete